MDKNSKFDYLKNKIKNINKSIIRNAGKNNKEVYENFSKLNSLLNKKFTKKEENEIFELFNKNLDQLQQNFIQHSNDQEVRFTRKLIKSKNPQIKNLEKVLFFPGFINLVKKEIKQAKISKKDKILFIGSGPLPTTAFLLNKYAKCKIDCFEECKEYSDISKKLIEKIGLSDGIKVYNKQGQSLGENSYTLIIIALLAKPKDEILDRLKKVISSKTKVICRTSKGIKRVLYEPIDLELFNGFKIESEVHVKDYQVYSLILKK